MSREDIIKRFGKILAEHGPLLSTEYDRLDIPDKPSRRLLFAHCGSWQNAVKEATQTCNLKLEPREVESSPHPEVLRLMQQVEDLKKSLQTSKLHLHGTEFKFGVISDTHIGSLFCDYGLLDVAYETFAARDVKIVLHAGDLLDGQKVYKGHDFEVETSGADSQINLCVDRYPRHDGITTYFINGNHDRSFWKRSGIDVGPKITTKRPDIVYLGYQEEDITLGDEPQNVVVRLFHPEGSGSAYALSYLAQRYVSELSNVNKPHLLIHGHTHKFNYMYYQNVFILQAGALQKQTPFMRGRKLASHQGFSIVDLVVTKKGVASMKVEFFPCY